MSTSGFSDEQLMAFADGQLDAATNTIISLASQKDRQLLQRIDGFRRSRELAKHALDLQLAEPVPAKLEANILALLAAQKSTAQTMAAQDGGVKASLAQKASNDNQRSYWFQLGAAASVALIAGTLAGSQLVPNHAAQSSARVAMSELSNPQISKLLATTRSGEETNLDDGGRFKVIATFNDAQSALCREFEIDGVSGQTIVSVACHKGQKWELRFAVAAGQTGEGYAPASSLELLESYYAVSGASPVLSSDAEKAALKGLDEAE